VVAPVLGSGLEVRPGERSTRPFRHPGLGILTGPYFRTRRSSWPVCDNVGEAVTWMCLATTCVVHLLPSKRFEIERARAAGFVPSCTITILSIRGFVLSFTLTGLRGDAYKGLIQLTSALSFCDLEQLPICRAE
jgi:hypothetical protein